MDETRRHDGASLTDQVSLFRRMARLAAADPLRLLPIDALAQLASLSAPATGLIELAPFERLRDAVGAPAAAARRETPRPRPQPFAPAGSDIARTAARAATGPASQIAGRNVTSAAARHEPSSTPSSLRLAGEALRRDAAPATSLADRRAALRRRRFDAASPATAPPPVPQEPAATDSRSISTIEARDVDHPARAGKALSEAIADQRRRLTAVPFDPSPIGRDNVPSMSNDPPSVAPDRAAKHVLSALTDRASVSTSPAAADLPIERDLPVALARGGANDPGSAGLSPADSSSMAGPWSQAARMPLADTAAGARQRAWKPESDSELADSLFETLYRDGVDLPWP